MFINLNEKKYLFEAIKNLNDAMVNLKQENTSLKNRVHYLEDDINDKLEAAQSQNEFYRKWVYDAERKLESPLESPLPKKVNPKVQVVHKRGRPLGSKNK